MNSKKGRKLSSRIFAWVLGLAMVIATLNTPAVAAISKADGFVAIIVVDGMNAAAPSNETLASDWKAIEEVVSDDSEITIHLFGNVEMPLGDCLEVTKGNVTLEAGNSNFGTVAQEAPIIVRSGSLTINANNASFTNGNGSIAVSVYGGNLTINGGNYVGNGYALNINGGNVEINKGSFKANSIAAMINGGNTVVKDGTFEGKIGGIQFGMTSAPDTTVDLSGGIYTGNAYAVLAKDTVLAEGYGFFSEENEELTAHIGGRPIETPDGKTATYAKVLPTEAENSIAHFTPAGEEEAIAFTKLSDLTNTFNYQNKNSGVLVIDDNIALNNNSLEISGDVTVDLGKYTITSKNDCVFYVSAGKLELNADGGKLISDGENAIYTYVDTELVINGGSYKSELCAVVVNGDVVITAGQFEGKFGAISLEKGATGKLSGGEFHNGLMATDYEIRLNGTSYVSNTLLEEGYIFAAADGNVFKNLPADGYSYGAANTVVTIAKCEHTKVTAEDNKDGTHKVICSICDSVVTEAEAHTFEEHACIECGAAEEVIKVTLYSSTTDGVLSIAKLSQDADSYYPGTTAVVTAEKLGGYTFVGWSVVTEVIEEDGLVTGLKCEDKILSTELEFEYEVSEDVALVAIYEANEEAKITIDSKNNYTVSVNGGKAEEFATQVITSYKVGTVLTLTATGEGFAYWKNESGAVLSYSPEYTFTVVGSTSVSAVYDSKVDSKVIVTFISGYDQIVMRTQVGAGASISLPSNPVKTGYTFAGWSINGEKVMADYTAAGFKLKLAEAIEAALETETVDDDVITVTAKYENKDETVSITIINGDAEGVTKDYKLNTIISVTAEEVEGKVFSHWEANGVIVSYSEKYSFYATADETIKAVYVDAEEEIAEAVGTTYIEAINVDSVNKKISFVSMSTVPEGCTIEMAGVIATSDATVANGEFTDKTATYVRGSAWSGTACRYTWTKGKVAETWYVRAYLVYTDAKGNTHTVYGDVVSAGIE